MCCAVGTYIYDLEKAIGGARAGQTPNFRGAKVSSVSFYFFIFLCVESSKKLNNLKKPTRKIPHIPLSLQYDPTLIAIIAVVRMTSFE